MKNQRGFTLPEMMVAVAIFSFMMMLVGFILRGGESQAQLSDVKMGLQTLVRESLYQMALEIRETSPSRVSVTNNGNTLTFQIPSSVSNAGTITWSSPMTYQVGGNGSQLIRTDAGTGPDIHFGESYSERDVRCYRSAYDKCWNDCNSPTNADEWPSFVSHFIQ